MSNMMRMLRRPECGRGCCGGERLRSAQRPAEKRRVTAEIDAELDYVYWLRYEEPWERYREITAWMRE